MSSRAHIHKPDNLLDKATDKLTAFSGSWLFLALHALWFGLWIGFRVEPFPFGLLTMMVSLEAIFLSTLVMMSQNRQAAKDHKRDDTEAFEVDQLVKEQEALKEINLKQTEILHQQSDMLELLRAPKPTAKK
jgi:uncharacterized membrane protein